MQGSWGAKDIFNEMAQDYVNIVNSMSGGRLKIDYLVGGAVVKPFEVQNATDKGVIDAAHTVPAYWYGKNKAASLFGTGRSEERRVGKEGGSKGGSGWAPAHKKKKKKR